MEATAANLEWAAPSQSGGSGIVGYRVDVRCAGQGDFAVLIANTCDPEPRARADSLEPMTWYEFKVAAINGHATGPSGSASEPLLTRATAAQERNVNASATASGRRRRTKQTFGGAIVAKEREAHSVHVAREANLAGEVERSLASIASWEEVFRVRHGRVARDEDRQESRVLRDEAHTLRVLRHALAEEGLFW